MVSIVAQVSSYSGFDPRKFSEEKLSMLLSLINLEESGQWLENADQTPLVLASGKLVLQKNR